jgi:hypothetical protein
MSEALLKEPITTPERAVEFAREHWGEGEPYWRIDEENTRLVQPEELQMIYSPPWGPAWYVPLKYDKPGAIRVGSRRALLVDPRRGKVREISIGE